VGGLVNVVSNLISLRALNSTSANYLLEGTQGNKTIALNAMTGLRGLNFSIGGYDRQLGDYKTPLGVQQNSFANSSGVSLGGSFVNAKGALKVMGDEAYIPNAKSKNTAFAYVAEKRWSDLKAEFGFRRENAQVSPEATLGLDSRKYGLNSGSAGINVPLGFGFSLLSNLSRNERAPVVEELYANGPHIASGTFEVGSASLKKERSTNLDLALQVVKPTFRFKASTYRNRFNDYIYGQMSDTNGDGIADRTDDAGIIGNDVLNPQNGELKLIQYKQTSAVFKGIELEGQWRPVGSRLGVKGFIDIARGTLNGNISGNAPRMSPSRISLSVDYSEPLGAGTANGYI
jgi:outer membrane receptor protein involved in Fe transport